MPQNRFGSVAARIVESLSSRRNVQRSVVFSDALAVQLAARLAVTENGIRAPCPIVSVHTASRRGGCLRIGLGNDISTDTSVDGSCRAVVPKASKNLDGSRQGLQFQNL